MFHISAGTWKAVVIMAIGEMSWNYIPFNIISLSATVSFKWPLPVELKSVNSKYQKF
jgi:hypothetical protein